MKEDYKKFFYTPSSDGLSRNIKILPPNVAPPLLNKAEYNEIMTKLALERAKYKKMKNELDIERLSDLIKDFLHENLPDGSSITPKMYVKDADPLGSGIHFGVLQKIENDNKVYKKFSISIVDNVLSKKKESPPLNFGYHNRKIEKGTLGESSKIAEEYEEFTESLEQNNPLMAMLELADLIGAIEAYAVKYNFTLADLIKMKETTERAFKTGYRK